jgi:hypothetical protein
MTRRTRFGTIAFACIVGVFVVAYFGVVDRFDGGWNRLFEASCDELEARCETTGAACVDLTRARSGAVFVTWLEPGVEPESVVLRLARHEVSDAAARTQLQGAKVLESDRLLVNWADVPRVLALSDTHLLVTYLERSGDAAHDYGVRFVCSTDAGESWTEPRWLHDHVGPGEHGFVALARDDDDTAVAVWLDGREMTGGEHGSHGAMTLRMRSVGVDGTLGPERVLDPRVCDCCQTDVARTSDGAWLVSYRDRSEDEVRDVKVLRVEGEQATTVFDSFDRFRFEGCPVNGPAIATRGDEAALVWFAPSLSGGGRVRTATSLDGGRSFPFSHTLDDEGPSGRVEVLFDECDLGGAVAHVYALWLGTAEGVPAWRYARFLPSQTGALSFADGFAFGTLAATTNSREIGFPHAVGVWHVFLAAYVSTSERCLVLHRAGWYVM